MACPFCKTNIKTQQMLKEGEYVYVIFSNPRMMPSHLLVIPKRHVERLSELDEKEKKELLDTVIEFQEKILTKVASGCDIRENYRPFIMDNKLKVSHLHIHLLPRKLEDELYVKSMIFEKDVFKDLSSEEIREMANLLK